MNKVINTCYTSDVNTITKIVFSIAYKLSCDGKKIALNSSNIFKRFYFSKKVAQSINVKKFLNVLKNNSLTQSNSLFDYTFLFNQPLSTVDYTICFFNCSNDNLEKIKKTLTSFIKNGVNNLIVIMINYSNKYIKTFGYLLNTYDNFFFYTCTKQESNEINTDLILNNKSYILPWIIKLCNMF
ncbi:MAG: hypothetical protein Ta2E_06320 [Mycoplasmoidaceae bacterium]|nr:MAG: hypothetical protein Ta2E_06320 [Mycoplasmoidaceae bacterium]